MGDNKIGTDRSAISPASGEKTEFQPSVLIDYGSIAAKTEAGSGSTTYDGTSYS